ncbi:MAG: hypothetical protein KAX19_14370 [Candidatus Brocadiae bacterium]|nr:hypothetical protein [Candidatus Brocadiia bacterium]
MSRWKLACGLVVVTVLACVGATMAQEGRRAGGGGQGRWDPEQMRQMMLDRIKESLGATDEEWTVIGPRYETATTLARDAHAGGGFGMFGRRGAFGGRAGRGGPGRGAAEAPLSETAQAADALRETLDNDASTPEQIKEKLTAYRAAREKAREELAKAQEALREVLSLSQEARLVLMGTLE